VSLQHVCLPRWPVERRASRSMRARCARTGALSRGARRPTAVPSWTTAAVPSIDDAPRRARSRERRRNRPAAARQAASPC
jgi:hypothetical protein